MALHWLVALLFLCAYSAVYYHQLFTERGTSAYLTSINLHYTFGVSIGVFVILRIIWRLTHQAPALPAGPAWEHFGARAAHGLLYLFMIGMPLTGYLGTKGGAPYFGVPPFPDTALYHWLVTDTLGLTWDQWRKPLRFFHFVSGGNVVWVLIAIHAMAALYHQYFKRDALMKRMWF